MSLSIAVVGSLKCSSQGKKEKEYIYIKASLFQAAGSNLDTSSSDGKAQADEVSGARGLEHGGEGGWGTIRCG